jgi:hypothetical protein
MEAYGHILSNQFQPYLLYVFLLMMIWEPKIQIGHPPQRIYPKYDRTFLFQPVVFQYKLFQVFLKDIVLQQTFLQNMYLNQPIYEQLLVLYQNRL